MHFYGLTKMGSGFEEPGGTPPPRIPRSTLPPPPLPLGREERLHEKRSAPASRTYSSQTTFEKNIQKFRKSLEERGYPAAIERKYLSEVKFADRKTAP